MHVGVAERDVAVINMSGWWMRSGDVAAEVSVIVGIGDVEELDGESVVKVPMTLTMSPVMIGYIKN